MSWEQLENEKDKRQLQSGINNAQVIIQHLRGQITNLETSHAALQDQLLLIQTMLVKTMEKVAELEDRLGGE